MHNNNTPGDLSPDKYRRDRAERDAYRQAISHLVDLGYPVFPLRPGGNRPMVKGWQAIARGDKVERLALDPYGDPYHERVAPPPILNYWTFPPLPNVGVMTGRLPDAPFSLLVLDIDPRHGGNESLPKLPKLPDTATVATPTDGRHFWFQHDPSKRYPNGASKLADGIDHRGQGGLVAAPPSMRPDGAYRWLAGPVEPWELAEVPDWLAELLTEIQRTKAPHSSNPYLGTTSTSGDGWHQADAMQAEQWLINATALLMRSNEGERNDRFTSLLAKGLFLAVDGLLDPDVVTEALSEAAAISGLPADEIAATTNSIANYVARNIDV